MVLRFWRLIAAYVLLLFAADANARCDGKQRYLQYKVVQGDTLFDIAQRYLSSPEDWRLLQRLNQVDDPLRLAQGHSLRLPFQRLRASAVSMQVIHAIGETTIFELGSTMAQPLKAGAQVHEGAVIRVAERGYLSLQLPDLSVIHVEPNSELRVQSLCNVLAGTLEFVRLRLDKGRVESTVTPRPAQSRFEVTTPLAVASVRGTQFGVEIATLGATGMEVTKGKVQVSPAGTSRSSVPVVGGQGVRLQSSKGFPMLSQLLPAPDLSMVSHSQVSTSLDLPLVPVVGAMRYRFKVATDPAFNQVLLSASDDALPIRLAGLDSGDYYVAVRAEDANGIPGQPSVRRVQLRTEPPPPFLREPARNAIVQGPSVSFSCTRSGPAMSYHLQISSDQEFRAPLAVPAKDECAFQVDGLAPGNYFWRAATAERAAFGDAVRGPWTDPIPFTVVPSLPKPVINAYTTTANTVHIELGAQMGGKYLLQVAEDSQFRHIVKELEETGSAVDLQLESGKVYYLRTQLLNRYGWRSPFSATREITMPAQLTSSGGEPVVDGLGAAITISQ